MNSNRLTWLRPLADNEVYSQERRGRVNLYMGRWNALIRVAPVQFNELLEQVYFRALEYYQLSQRAMPLAVLNRTFGKRWFTVFKQASMPPIDLLSTLHAASLSGTLPLLLRMNHKGATLIMPEAVQKTIIARTEFNYGLLVALNGGAPLDTNYVVPEYKPPGWFHDVPELTDIWSGLCPGPTLSDSGISAAMAPFESRPAVPGECHSDQVFDTTQMTDSTVVLAGVVEMTESSTLMHTPGGLQSS